MSNEALTKMIWFCGIKEHEHLSWESANECAQIFPLLEQLKLETLRMAFSWLEFVRVMRTELPETGSELEESYKKLYFSLRAEYEAAGEPFGHGEEAMNRWFRNLTDRI
jgi:hypothetical protein